MLELINVVKRYPAKGGARTVLSGVSLAIHPGQKWGILGRNGSGKSTLIRLMAGAETPTSGEVVRHMSVSWPLAFGGGFQGGLTGLDNAKFVARIYGKPVDQVVDYVQSFAEIGRAFYEPVMSYSSGMRARLAFGLSLAIDFDALLIDEITAVGDASFKKKSEALLRDRLRQSAAIFVSHSTEQMERMCQSGAVLQEGRMFYYNDVKKASEHYSYTIKRQLPPWLRKKS